MPGPYRKFALEVFIEAILGVNLSKNFISRFWEKACDGRNAFVKIKNIKNKIDLIITILFTNFTTSGFFNFDSVYFMSRGFIQQ